MRKLFAFIAALFLINSANGQRSIDDLFSKYSGKEGYTTVTLSGDLLKWATQNKSENQSESKYPERLTEIRLLAAQDDVEDVPNFFDHIMRGLYFKSYEELVRVKEHNQDLVVMVKPERNGFSELIIVAGGEDNVVVQMKGFITRAEARKLSSEIEEKKSTGDISLSF
jgi:hypothetical protein